MIRKIVRTVAIALIFLPEPVTTALGIMILSATFIFPRKASLKRFGDLEDLLKRSLRNEELIDFKRGSAAKRMVIHHTLRLDMAVPAPFQYHSWFDNRRISANVIHHILRTSFPQFEALEDRRRDGCGTGAGRPGSEPAVEYHKLKLNLATRQVEESSDSVFAAPVFHHRLKSELMPNLN